MNRRDFFQTVVYAAGVAPLLAQHSLSGKTGTTENPDEVLCDKKFKLAVSRGWVKLPIGEVIVRVGETFLGTPYVAHVLEARGPEHLIVNMRGLDCVSFYENSLVIARCIKLNKMTFEEYKRQLQFIRYRNGVIEGYASRLHYTSDYFYEDEKRGVWKLIAKDLGGVPFKKRLDFMSTHPETYWQIRESEKVKAQIENMEKDIAHHEIYYIPKSDVAAIADKIHDGDILGMTTNIEGIDTSHTGVAVWKDKHVHLMHAPLSGQEVMISDYPLPEYLEHIKSMTGILIARPLEPV